MPVFLTQLRKSGTLVDWDSHRICVTEEEARASEALFHGMAGKDTGRQCEFSVEGSAHPNFESFSLEGASCRWKLGRCSSCGWPTMKLRNFGWRDCALPFEPATEIIPGLACLPFITQLDLSAA